MNGPSTANGYGHWFNASGNVCSYGNASYVYSELNTATLAFNVGQYPGRCRNGQVYQLGQAFRYKDANGKVGVAKLIFHIYIGGVPTDIEAVSDHERSRANNSVYDLTGRRFSGSSHLSPGIYVIDGRKVLIK